MFSKRKQVLWAKLETTYATDPTPAATDAILIGNPTISPLEGGSVSRDVILPYFGDLGQIRVENYAKISFDTEIGGSGTAGTAPKIANLLKACNLTETLLAAAVTGTGTAGATSTITLAAGASAVDDFYTGMSIALTAGTGSGQTREILSYVGATKIATVATPWTTTPDATSAYSIGANAMYTPNSSIGPITNTSCTLHWYMDGKRHILLGARGTLKADITVKQEPKFSWEFTGLLGTISDTALATANFTSWQVPVTVSSANTTDINILGLALPTLQKFSFDLGNTIVYRQLIGQESVLITDRKVMGAATLEDMPIATKDFFTMAKSNTYAQICLKHGQTAGNIFGVTGRNVQCQNPKYSDLDNINMLDVGLQYTPYATTGNDEIRLCFK